MVIFPSLIFAQANYHAGYVIKTNGDTLKGYIDYQEWNLSPHSIDFKVHKEDHGKLKLSPVTIRRVVVTDADAYTGYVGNISMNRINLDDLRTFLDTTAKADTVFLKQLVTGRHLTLLVHSDAVKSRYFIAEGDGLPMELKYYLFYNSNNELSTSAIYKGQLVIFVNEFYPGNKKLLSQLEDLKYNELDLEHFVDELNNAGKRVKKKSTNRLFVGAGIDRTVTEENTLNFPAIQDYTTISPRINLGIDFFNNPNVQRFVFRGELSFSYVNPTYTSTQEVVTTSTSVYQFTQYTASLIPQVLINLYNKENFKFYVDAGISFNFSAYSNSKLTTQYSGFAAETTVTKNPFMQEATWTSIPFQAGIVLNKKIELYVSRSGFYAFTKTVGYESNETYSAGVKFLFSHVAKP